MTTRSTSKLSHWQRRLLVLLATLGMLASQTVGVAFSAPPSGVVGSDVTVKWYGLTSDHGTRKTSLEPSDGYACGDVVHFEAEVELDAGAPAGSHVLRMTFEFAQEPTGGQGVGFRGLSLVHGDGTAFSNSFPTATDAGGRLTQDGEVVVEVAIVPGETRNVFIDVLLGCSAPFKLKGNVHTGVGDIVADPGTPDENTFGAGNQTVPLTTSVSQTQLTIVKDAPGASAAELFTFTFGPVGGATEDFELADGESWDTPVYPGTYRVLETALPTGWSLDDVTCTGAAPSDVTGGIDITVPFDADVTCTFHNAVTPAPAITVVKEIWDGDSWEDADSTPVTFSLGDTVDYRITVTNTGNVDLTGVTLSDSLYTLVSAQGGTTACTIPSALAVGDDFICWARTTAAVGTTTNTATADSTETDAVTDDAVYTVASAPAMTVVKEIWDGDSWEDADSTPVTFSLGDTVDYRITVTNTGNVDLTGVTLSDSLYTLVSAQGGTTACTIPSALAVGDDFICWARTTAAVGTTTNTATADSTETDAVTDDAVYTVTAAPSVLVRKFVWDPADSRYVDADNRSNGPWYEVGETVRYRITVENTGNVPLTGFTLTDPDLPALTGTDGGADACDVPSTLPVGATVHDCYGTTTAVFTAPDGETRNEATGTGTHEDRTVSDEDHAWYRVEAIETLSVEKQVTVKTLSQSPEDPELPSQEATWLPADTPPGPTATIGTHEVWFKAIVTNTGDVPMTLAHLSDTLINPTTGAALETPSDLFSGCDLPEVALAPGATYECVDGPVVPTVPGTFGNLVTAEAIDPSPEVGLRSLANDTRVAFAHAVPTLTFPPAPVPAGHPAFAFFTAVTPTVIIPPSGPDPATLTIQKQTLPDGDPTDFTFTPSTNLSASTFQLADGESRTFTGLGAGTYTVTESARGGGWSLTSIACGTAAFTRVGSQLSITLAAGQSATCVFTNTLTEVAPVVIEANPALTVVKTALLEPDADGGLSVVYTPGSGTVIEYEYTITNTGDVTITDITAFDDILGELFPATTTLAPGESTTATATHLLTQADADAQAVVNTVTVTGTAPDGTEVSATDTESVDVIEVLPTVIERPEPAPEPEPAELPRTGSDTAGLFALSLLLMATGLAALGFGLRLPRQWKG